MCAMCGFAPSDLRVPGQVEKPAGAHYGNRERDDDEEQRPLGAWRIIDDLPVAGGRPEPR